MGHFTRKRIYSDDPRLQTIVPPSFLYPTTFFSPPLSFFSSFGPFSPVVARSFSLYRLSRSTCCQVQAVDPYRAHKHIDKQVVWNQFVFEMNHASICGDMMTAFVLDAMPVNAAFQSVLSNDIVV
ncbi:hypothetical protein TNCV_311171 [Trichonephila clavipes]|nr:hypothetical protein TNCV_311171 [Trichonephila clavipes]